MCEIPVQCRYSLWSRVKEQCERTIFSSGFSRFKTCLTLVPVAVDFQCYDPKRRLQPLKSPCPHYVQELRHSNSLSLPPLLYSEFRYVAKLATYLLAQNVVHSISVTRDPVTRASTGIWEKIRDNQYWDFKVKRHSNYRKGRSFKKWLFCLIALIFS